MMRRAASAPRPTAAIGLAAVVALTLSAAPALSQEPPAGNDCQNVNPIAGSLEYRLAALALRGNAQTYGAAALTDRGLLSPMSRLEISEETRGDDEGSMVLAFSMNQTFGVLDVPTVEQNSGCPRELKYSTRPLDMAGMSFGFGYRQDDWGLFYAGSVTYSFLAADNGPLRGMIAGSAAIGASYVVLLGPLIDSANREAGVVSFNADYVVGAFYDFGPVAAALGFVGSQGLYARLGGVDIGGFVSGVFDADTGVATLDLELGPYDLGPISPRIWGTRKAIVAPGVTDAQGLTGRGTTEAAAWSVAGVELQDISGMLDLRFAWMFEPEMRYSEAIATVHSARYNAPIVDGKGLLDTDFPVDFALFGGVVGLPQMRYYGLEGGAVFSAGGEVRVGGRAGIVLRAVYNDPARLTLFPYSVGHFAIDYGLGGAF